MYPASLILGILTGLFLLFKPNLKVGNRKEIKGDSLKFLAILIIMCPVSCLFISDNTGNYYIIFSPMALLVFCTIFVPYFFSTQTHIDTTNINISKIKKTVKRDIDDLVSNRQIVKPPVYKKFFTYNGDSYLWLWIVFDDEPGNREAKLICYNAHNDAYTITTKSSNKINGTILTGWGTFLDTLNGIQSLSKSN